MMHFDWTLILNLILAAACGAALGLEREIHRKPAGLRTNMLIALGSALFTYSSIAVAMEYGSGQKGDPGRIAAQIVTGIGFLGAGAIMRHEDQITGLTSAATVWVVASIGILAGANRALLAITGTAIALGILHLMMRLEGVVLAQVVRCQADLVAADREALLTDMEAFCRARRMSVQSLEHHPLEEGRLLEIRIQYHILRRRQPEICQGLASLDGVREVKARIM